MRTLLSLSLILLLSLSGLSQQKPEPATWTATYKPLNDKEGELLITGILEKGWHTYSQRATDAGPISTSISFAPSADYSLVGKAEESGAQEEYDKAFEAKLYVFNARAEFKQKIKLNKKGPVKLSLKLEYICCNDSMCLPPKTVDLNLNTH